MFAVAVMQRVARVCQRQLILAIGKLSFEDHVDFALTQRVYLWSPYVIGQTIIFSCCFFLLFFPRLISAVGDWMFTIVWHMVWP